MDDVEQAPSPRSDFVTLYERHYGAVLAYARRRVDEHAARDVTAETFLVAWRRLDLAQERGLPWLYETAAHTLRNHARTERRAIALQHRVKDLSTRDDGVDPADTHAERDRVLQAVRSLSPTDQELLLLTVWEGLDVRTAAMVAGCSVGAAHVRLHRSRRRLRALLTAPGSHIRHVVKEDAHPVQEVRR